MGQHAELRAARASDERAVEALLAAEGLPPAASAAGSTHFLVIDDDGEVIAAAGIESCGSVALLRSVVVARAYRQQGLARRLTESLVVEARALGHEALYLLTTDADDYFAGLDFVAVDREGAPEAIRRSREFREQCPDSAVLMRRVL